MLEQHERLFAAEAVAFHTGAFQADKRVRIYDTERDWQLVKDIHARNLRWTITDTCLSKDQSLLLYATINPIVHLVRTSKPAQQMGEVRKASMLQQDLSERHDP